MGNLSNQPESLYLYECIRVVKSAGNEIRSI